MPNSSATIYLRDYQPYPFIVKTVSLTFDLFDDHTVVRNTMVLERRGSGPLRLVGQELELLSVSIDGRPLSADAYQCHQDDLDILTCPDTFQLTIETRIYPHKNTQLSGLYRSNHLFCTQCEAEGFRRITYFPDRPDVLAIYTTRISADKKQYPVLLSNGNRMELGDSEDGRHWVTWHDPFPKPSYLFALVAGDLVAVHDEFTTCSGRSIALSIYVEPGYEDQCTHAMQSLKKAMRWDEECYGREYDLDVFMIVAVSDFNMGAMENKGLNIFNSKFILARPDTATDQDYADIEGVVAHEYFHNWTGNRVTCRDWFQLSLKEGLTVFRDQEFSRDMNSRDLNRIADVQALRMSQFPEDAGCMAHPVRPSSYQEINNFYTATIYNKGAELIRMQQALLGAAGFRRGMDLYFERHDGQAVTIDDFVAAMEDANAVDLTQFKRWYDQAGTPEVNVMSTFEQGYLTMTLTQSCRPTPECKVKQPFHIPIQFALFDQDGQKIQLQTDRIELKEREQRLQWGPFASRPVASLLRDFSAPIMLHHAQDVGDLVHLLRYETNGFSKWDAGQRLMMQWLIQQYKTTSGRIDDHLMDAFKHVLLDEAHDPGLRAYILTPPSFEDAVNQIERVDVGRLEALRDTWRQALGAALWDTAEECYHRLGLDEDHSMSPEAFARRQLRNQCLWLMMKGDEGRAMGLCQQQYATAKTMTDSIASLRLLVDSKADDEREKALHDFYQRWQKHDLVLDKWFTLQAMCERDDALQQVKGLLSHQAFSLKNPNKVRALIGAFTAMNPRHFHAADGSGYAFLTDLLIQLDGINSQVSARMATPLTRWHRLDDSRQQLMKQQLHHLASLTLSRDLNEMVHKSLV